MKMARFYLQVLQLLVLLFVIECKDSSPVTVSASQEEDALLPCFNSSVIDPKNCYRVKWTKQVTHPRQMKVILTRPKTSKFQDADRVKWEADGNGQMSLLLTKLQKSDEGLYSCEIWKGWDCILVKNISLKVKDCKTHKAVKAAPNTTANLICPVNITSGQQRPLNISWAMLKGGNPVPLFLNRVEINESSLSIQSVSESDSRWYRCTYMLGQTQRCFDINLQVQVEDVVTATTVPVTTTMTVQGKSMKEESSGPFNAVVASVITVIAVTAALIGLFVYCRFNIQRVTQQTQRHQADAPIQSDDTYETVDDMISEDHINLSVNSTYQQCLDESMFTLTYK
ncbi:uncharacterized protein LOC122986659 [Thunnus albacares]|uniref:uncharacterized protein LOC122986659 n=1 Tax=Thunnus albacares TaxID=8236 RepID=UPI001CF6E77C|nr:uncharacterized protein LOC122986659 [Thunnus albacares]